MNTGNGIATHSYPSYRYIKLAMPRRASDGGASIGEWQLTVTQTGFQAVNALITRSLYTHQPNSAAGSALSLKSYAIATSSVMSSITSRSAR